MAGTLSAVRENHVVPKIHDSAAEALHGLLFDGMSIAAEVAPGVSAEQVRAMTEASSQEQVARVRRD